MKGWDSVKAGFSDGFPIAGSLLRFFPSFFPFLSPARRLARRECGAAKLTEFRETKSRNDHWPWKRLEQFNNCPLLSESEWANARARASARERSRQIRIAQYRITRCLWQVPDVALRDDRRTMDEGAILELDRADETRRIHIVISTRFYREFDQCNVLLRGHRFG